ncbi:MAG: alpha-glucosidase [Deltaproteobacteria bacterium]|nr:alpha-glucosidase [Deltaproteobacteria bacterium]
MPLRAIVDEEREDEAPWLRWQTLDGGLVFQRPRDSVVYGFGAATGEATRNRATFRVLTQDTLMFGIAGAAFTAHPFFVVRSRAGCVGVLIDTTLPLAVRCEEERVVITPLAGDTPLPVVVFSGTPKEILDAYTMRTGRPFMPPLWALGFHQSRWSYKSQRRVLAIARRMRREQVPCDAIYLDIHYMDRFRVFTWHPRRFPDPERMHDELQALGLRTMAIVDPGVSASDYWVYKDGLAGEMFCKRSDGRVYMGKVWPGETAFPDFSREAVRDWWASHHRALFDRGVSGIWNDMNDPTLKVGVDYDPLREDLLQSGAPHARSRNLYANHMAIATRAAFSEARPNERPFLLTRSGTTGIQQHAAVWTGDNLSTWAHLNEALHRVKNLGLSGVPFCGADVGGFGGRPGKWGAVKLHVPRELMGRWIELAALMPLMRMHTVLVSPSQEPWSFGRRILALAKKHIRRRYRLLPYLYAQLYAAHVSGAPVVRPLWFDDASVPLDVGDDQFMCGPALLAAPVLAAKTTQRSVYLPPGEWFDYETGAPHSGETSVTAPLGVSPLFVRAGAVIPCFRAADTSDLSRTGPLRLEVYAPNAPGPLFGEMYLDDGLSATPGAFRLVRFSGALDRDGMLTLTLHTEHNGFVPPQATLQIAVPERFCRLTGASLDHGAVLQLSTEDRPQRMRIYDVAIDTTQVRFVAVGR